MSGETEEKPSSWTIDSLHTHLIKMMAEKDLRDQQRFDALEARQMDQFQAQDKAIVKQENSTEKRFEGVNEFRDQLRDQATLFMPRSEAEQRTNQNTEKIDALDRRLTTALSQVTSRLDLTAGRSTGRDDIAGWIVGAGGLIVAVVAVVAGLR